MRTSKFSEEQVHLDFNRRSTPSDNAVCEAVNGSVRRECLSQAYSTWL